MKKFTRAPFLAFFPCIAFLALGALLGGCAATAHRDADYVFVYLVTGPESANKTADERKTIFEGHMSNMKRLGEERKLIIAGPFDKPHNTSWRGIFLMDVPTVAEARALVATDPGIKAGVFVAQMHPFKASPTLRNTHDFEKNFQADRAAHPDEKIPQVRAYVMLTARNFDRAEKALLASPLASHIIWHGRFSDTPGGVFVFDAEHAERIEAAISDMDVGACVVDGWWSSPAMMKLSH